MKNKLIIAVAGSGKTTHLVREALSKSGNVLITTYTEANAVEIQNKIYNEKGYIPQNITVKTWFSFLLQHLVRPYQSLMDESLCGIRIGFFLNPGRSALYVKKNNVLKYYFTESFKIYSDKISEFAYEVNKKSNNIIRRRLSRIFQHIFIDEAQDLAGWDYDILKLLFDSAANVLLVGDPRQCTYTTNDSAKNNKFKKKFHEYIEHFFSDECIIDEEVLMTSHRNSKAICEFSSQLFPNLRASVPCNCLECRRVISGHSGVYIVENADKEAYIQSFSPQVLVYSKSKNEELNFGASKGLSFDRVLIKPTGKISKFLVKRDLSILDSPSTISKFYVALTRARYSVGIIHNSKKFGRIDSLPYFQDSSSG